jgi:predicted lipoprotein with Yx(FWY)xxD motif
LAPSAIFYGTNETTLGIAGIQVMLRADQNCTVYVDQSSDNINYDISDSYIYYASLGGNSWTTQAVGSSFRVRVLNLSSTGSTTTFRLGTALCPIVEAVPRALSSNGNFKVDVGEMLGDYGDQVKSSVSGQLSVAQNTRLLGATFAGPTVDSNFWGGINTGSTTISQANGVLTIATNATANSTGTLSSVRVARYVSGMSNFFRGVIRAPAATGNCVRRWGAFNASNGFFFEVDSGTFSVVTRISGADTKVASGSLNGLSGSTYVVDEGVHTYQIFWSNKSAWFAIDDVLVHKSSSNGATMLSGDLSLNAAAQCSNTNGNTNANTLQVRVMAISRQGHQTNQPILKNIQAAGASLNVLKLGPGNLHEILLNQPGAAGLLATVYDGTGNPAVWQTWGTLGVGVGSSTTIAGQGKMQWDYKGVPFYQGLTITTSGVVDLSVIYE